MLSSLIDIKEIVIMINLNEYDVNFQTAVCFQTFFTSTPLKVIFEVSSLEHMILLPIQIFRKRFCII